MQAYAFQAIIDQCFHGEVIDFFLPGKEAGTLADNVLACVVGECFWSQGYLIRCGQGKDKLALMKLSLFCGGATAQAIQHVAQADNAILIQLMDKSFMRQTTSGRYEIHEVLRRYAAEKFMSVFAKDMIKNAYELHGQFFADFLFGWQTALKGKGRRQALAAVEAEIGNIRQAWQRAGQHVDIEQIERGLESLHLFYKVKSWFQEGEEAMAHIATSLQSQEQLTPAAQQQLTKALLRQGAFLYYQGNYQKAVTLLQDCQQTGLATSDERAFCLLYLANTYLRQGKYDEAEHLLQEALPLAQTAESRHIEPDILRAMSAIFYGRGDYVQARHFMQQALPLYRQINDRIGEAATLGNLGVIFHKLGQWDLAQTHTQQNLHIARQMGNRLSESLALGNLGNIFLEQQQWELAITHFQQELSISEEIGGQMGQVQCTVIWGKPDRLFIIWNKR